MLVHLDAPLRQLLVHDPLYRIDDIELKIDGEEGRGALHFSSRGTADALPQRPLIMLLAQHGEFGGRVSLPRDWVLAVMTGSRGDGAPRIDADSANAQLDALATAGFIDAVDERIAGRIGYAQGRLRINGQAFPPEGP